MAALGERKQVPLVHLGEGVVQGPEVARGKLFVRGLLPLIENIRDHRLADCTGPIATQDQIARFLIGKLAALIGRDARFVLRPHIGQGTNRTPDNLGQVAQHVRRMATGEHNLVVKNEIAAHEGSVARADASGETLVVRVTQADDGASGASLAEVNLEKAEVTLTEAGNRVQFLLDGQIRRAHIVAEDRNEIRVRDGLIGRRLLGRLDGGEFSDADLGIIGTADAEVDGVHTLGGWARRTARANLFLLFLQGAKKARKNARTARAGETFLLMGDFLQFFYSRARPGQKIRSSTH